MIPNIEEKLKIAFLQGKQIGILKAVLKLQKQARKIEKKRIKIQSGLPDADFGKDRRK